jgi:hypothetical protein
MRRRKPWTRRRRRTLGCHVRLGIEPPYKSRPNPGPNSARGYSVPPCIGCSLYPWPSGASNSYGNRVHAPFVRKGAALPCRGTAPPCPSSRCLSPVPAGDVRRVPPPHIPFSAFSLPCEIVRISQDRPCLASEHTRSVERKQGKGVVTGFPGGRPHPASPAERERGPSRPPHSPESFCMTNHACTLETKTSGNCQRLFICFANGAQSPLLCLPFIVKCEMRQVF